MTVMLASAGIGAAQAQDAELVGVFSAIGYNNDGGQDGLSSITFDGAGNFSGTITQNNGGTITSGSLSGTYTVGANGAVTFTPLTGEVETGNISPDGNSVALAKITATDNPGVLIFIRQPQGNHNNASGLLAEFSNTTGTENSAFGYGSLYSNTTGNRNNASGEGALYSNTTASDNNAMGVNALTDNTTGSLNNAVGNFAMEYSTTGNNNNAVGYGALLHNTTGSDNSAQGYEALASSTSGNLNIGVGYKAGFSQTTGSQNIYLGNSGVAAESNVIRIGSSSGVSTQTAAFIAGISGNVQTGGAVVVTASGQLGVASSSRRYKEDIQPLGDVSERLYDLHPVKFRYIKPDEQGQKPVQFGLIAEEVADVLPEVVYRNAEGKVEGVRYDELAPLVVNELKQQQERIAALERQVEELKSLVAKVTQQTPEVQLAAR